MSFHICQLVKAYLQENKRVNSRKNMYVFSIIFLLLYCIIFPQYIQASMREIMIGDIIKLKVNVPGLSKFDLIEKFDEFEIIDIKKEGNEEYIISIRTFEPVTKNIQIGDKNIKIKVISLLDTINRDGLFEPELSIIKPSSIYIYILGIIIPLLIILFLLLQLNILTKSIIDGKKVKKQEVNPYILAKERLQNCNQQRCYFAYLTYILKEYIDNMYQLNIRGKSAEEIIAILKNITELKDYIKKIEDYLYRLEEYKYKNIEVDNQLKQKEKAFLSELIELINKENTPVVEGNWYV